MSTPEEVEKQCLTSTTDDVSVNVPVETGNGTVETAVSYKHICYHFLGCPTLEQARANPSFYPYRIIYTVLSFLLCALALLLYSFHQLNIVQMTVLIVVGFIVLTLVFAALYCHYNPGEALPGLPYLKVLAFAAAASVPLILFFAVFCFGIHIAAGYALMAALATYLILLLCGVMGWERWHRSRLEAIHDQIAEPR